jgi:hypothetical protein
MKEGNKQRAVIILKGKKFVEKEQTYENYKFAPTQIIFRNIFRKTSENISENYFQKKRKHSK